jgi:hypothetical protein
VGFVFQIPFIQKAKAMSQQDVKLFGSPWSAPGWMKTNKNMTGNGTLIGQPGGKYYQTWANYFVRYCLCCTNVVILCYKPRNPHGSGCIVKLGKALFVCLFVCYQIFSQLDPISQFPFVGI